MDEANILPIAISSEAGRTLRAMFLHPSTHTVRLSFGPNGTVKVKQNGGMWTPALSTAPQV